MSAIEMSHDEIREIVLDELRKSLPRKTAGTKISYRELVRAACQRAEATQRGPGDHVVVEVFDRLLNEGILVRGFDRNNLGFEYIAISTLGLEVIGDLDRDPANAPGYLRELAAALSPETIAYAYAEESVRALQANCLRASAVLIGAASESLVLEVRDDVVAALTRAAKAPTKKDPLLDWRTKPVIGAVEAAVRASKTTMPRALEELIDTRWGNLLHHVRLARNEAGHPASLKALDRDDARANLILFVGIARMTRQLRGWIASGYAP